MTRCSPPGARPSSTSRPCPRPSRTRRSSIVVDVGHTIELYSDFTRQGRTYIPFPDALTHRIKLRDLADETIRERLRLVWTDPLGLDPSRRSAKVTREVAERLAKLAQSLEAVGIRARGGRPVPDALPVHVLRRGRRVAPHGRRSRRCCGASASGSETAALSRDGPFALGDDEDGRILADPPSPVAPLQRRAVRERRRPAPDRRTTRLARSRPARRNGGTSSRPSSGRCWNAPLNPIERHKLGAHYTPRAYVERLVLPTIIEPLREEWANVQAAAVTLANEGKLTEARDEVRDFLRKLCDTTVLDPACGTGNFLYVTLEHMKRLEGEVLRHAAGLRRDAGRLRGVRPDGRSRTSSSGIEINPRAAAIADLVLWIGYLQWHFRTFGDRMPGRADHPGLPQHRMPGRRPGVRTGGRCHVDERGRPGDALGRPDDEAPSGDGGGRAGRDGPGAGLEQYVKPAEGGVAGGGLHRGESAVHWPGPLRAAVGERLRRGPPDPSMTTSPIPSISSSTGGIMPRSS